jgi:putative endonuclease
VFPFFIGLYSIYILYSAVSDLYYVGFSEDPQRRLIEHNHPQRTKFTSKHLPWTLVCSFGIAEERGLARKAENYIKRRKSRKYIEKLISNPEERMRLAQLVRVPPRQEDKSGPGRD